MKHSVKFRDIAKHELAIAKIICDNQNIMRYMCYMTDDPLAERTVNRKGEIVEQPDLDIDYKSAHISIQSFNNKILDTSHLSMFIHPLKGALFANRTIGDITYAIDIVCPEDFQVFDGKIEYRDYNIADEICRDIDGKKITGFGDVEIVDFNSGKLEQDYTFLTLFVRVRNFTLKGDCCDK